MRISHQKWNRRQFLGAAALAATGPWPARAAPGKLRGGAATANITPLLGCSLAGGMTDRIGTEVHDELHVRNFYGARVPQPPYHQMQRYAGLTPGGWVDAGGGEAVYICLEPEPKTEFRGGGMHL